MKTNYMIALSASEQWKAPWRQPIGIAEMKAELSIRNRMRKIFRETFKKTAKDFESIIRRHWAHD